MANPTVYVVHCVDAEGPLRDSPDAQAISWDRIDSMISEATSAEFRERHADPTGHGWIFSWFAADSSLSETGYPNDDPNPHEILDRYSRFLQANASKDELHWHFRPSFASGIPSERNAALLHYPQMIGRLTRQVVERGWFPACFHPGPYSERSDTHWLLEQWIPFDFANRSVSRYRGLKRSIEQETGASMEWRRAVWDWSHYRPSYDDIQREGSCNRTIFKCLPTENHDRQLNQTETELAFRRADEGYPTVLAFYSRDSMELSPVVEYVYSLLKEAERKYPNVRWEHSGALNAARQSLGLRDIRPLELEAEFEKHDSGLLLRVRSNKDTFGAQPFLALKTKDGHFRHGSFEPLSHKREWFCLFDSTTIPPESLSRIGVAASDSSGNVHVMLFQGDGTPILPTERDHSLYREELIG